MTPFPSFTAEPFLPQEDSPLAVHQTHDQDFRGLFPPVHRPLSVLDVSEAERGLWLYEQVCDGDDVCFACLGARTKATIAAAAPAALLCSTTSFLAI